MTVQLDSPLSSICSIAMLMSRAVVIVSVTFAGPVAANPFGVTRQGGVAIAALKSLTPEQARELVAKRSEATVRIDTGKAALAFARGGVSFRGALMLPSLESLDAETAAVLADYDDGPLFLDGLTELSPESARALKKFKGGPRSYASFGNCLSLAGLETLSPEAAAELAVFPGEALSDDVLAALAEYNGGGLGLGGLTTVSPELAKRLATFATKFLFLDDVIELSPEAAAALAGFPGTVSLDGLTEIDPETAKALAKHAGPQLSLRGLKNLSAETAEQLAKAKTWNGSLSCLRSLSDKAAAALAGFEGKGLAIPVLLSDRAVQVLAGFRGAGLYLFVPQLSDESVQALATFKGDSLTLAGLQEPPAELARLLPEFACKNLSLHPWEYYLGSRQPVTPADARLVSAYAGRLGKTCVLPGITGFETPSAVEIAKILAASPGSLSIPNLERVSVKTLSALITNGNVQLPPFAALILIREPDGSFSDDFVIPENFPAFQRR